VADKTFHMWNTQHTPNLCPCPIYEEANAADLWYFPHDNTRLKSYTSGCLVANSSTSSVDFGACNPDSPAGSWIIETLGKASAPAQAPPSQSLLLGVPWVCPGCTLGVLRPASA